jgi:hypothetical protein
MHTARWLLFAAGAVVLVLGAAEILLRRAASRLRPLSEWRNWEMEFKVAAVNNLSAEGGASVVAVGSSTMNAAVDPEVLSQRTDRTRPAFNAALNGAGMRLLELWTLRIVLPRLRPDIVVIGLGSGEVNKGNAVGKRLLDALLTSPAGGEDTTEGTRSGRLIRWVEERSFVVRYRRFLGRASLFQPDPRQRASECRRLGLLRWFLVFRFRKYTIEDQQIQLWKEVLDGYEVGGEEMAALGRLIDGLRAAGVAPVVVRMPCTDDWVDLHPGGRRDFENFETALDSAARQHDVPHVDLRTPFSSLEEFADPVHLNGEGQVRFTNLLADVLAQLPAPSRT